MSKDSENLAEKLSEIITEAEKAVSKISDTDLRRVAFDRILERMLQTNIHFLEKAKTVKATPEKTSGKETKAKPGTKTWLEELIDEDYFKTPKSSKNILEALNERGHILKSTDITGPLSLLVNEKRLRRQKMAVQGGKSQLHWYNW